MKKNTVPADIVAVFPFWGKSLSQLGSHWESLSRFRTSVSSYQSIHDWTYNNARINLKYWFNAINGGFVEVFKKKEIFFSFLQTPWRDNLLCRRHICSCQSQRGVCCPGIVNKYASHIIGVFPKLVGTTRAVKQNTSILKAEFPAL